MKNKKYLLTGSIIVLVIAIIGVSYAFFSALIKGNDTAAKNTVSSGTMELTFAEKEDENIYFENARPGDSDSKTFTVENTGTLEDVYTYNIKLTNLYVTYKEKDLTYTLQEYTDETFGEEKADGIKASGYINKETLNINKEMYLATGITRPEKGKKHYYKLTITFENLEVPQDYNQGAEFRGKINVDDEAGAIMYDTLPDHPFYAKMMSNPDEVAADDPDGNLRYIGENPHNYIWFNCDDYTKVTDEITAAEQNCEKWRIIGLMKNITKEDNSKENLVKIVRAESIGDMKWNSAYSSSWAKSPIETTLNSEENGYITSNYNQNEVKGITTNTKNMIETVIWNTGGIDKQYETTGTAEVFYNVERGNKVYSSGGIAVGGLTWEGRIALIYPSDFGYATSGGGLTTRNDCLIKEMSRYGWGTSPYNTDCVGNDWLKPSSLSWTLTPQTDNANSVYGVGTAGTVYPYATFETRSVRPALYLSSNVKIKEDEESDGSELTPYILVP